MPENIPTHQSSDDFIVTYPSQYSDKYYLYIPYISAIAPQKKKHCYTITYNGGQLDVNLANVSFIMLYGITSDLSAQFLEDCYTHKVSILIHRRNVATPYIFMPSHGSDIQDILTKQIIFRENQKKATYIAKTLIHARITSMQNLFPYLAFSPISTKKLRSSTSVKEVMAIEAYYTKAYWDMFYNTLGVDTTRRSQHPISKTLDACSFFMYGIILRWVLFHKLSPAHAFLHSTTHYPSLCYDLMEPYRYIFEEIVFNLYMKEENKEANLTAKALNQLKDTIEQVIYCPTTRQNSKNKNLFHGIVLALRAYLLGKSQRFVIPISGQKQGGRPVKVDYKLPGQRI
jgi:CRISPR-associated endonuclease Cas1